MKVVFLVFVLLVVCAIFGTSFLAAIADFAYDVFMKVFKFGFEVSSCLIRTIALIFFFLLLYEGYALLVGG